MPEVAVERVYFGVCCLGLMLAGGRNTAQHAVGVACPFRLCRFGVYRLVPFSFSRPNVTAPEGFAGVLVVAPVVASGGAGGCCPLPGCIVFSLALDLVLLMVVIASGGAGGCCPLPGAPLR